MRTPLDHGSVAPARPTAAGEGEPATPVLLTPARPTSTGVLLAEAAGRRGLETRRMTGPGVVTALTGRPVHWYGGPHAADLVAAGLALALLEPPDTWLPDLPGEFTGRDVQLTTLAEASALVRPAFVKPPTDKCFPPRVYADGAALRSATPALPPDTPVLVADPVEFAAEYRLFVLDGDVVTGARYATGGLLDVAPLTGEAREPAVRRFAAALLGAAGHTLPSAVVLDVGLLRDRAGGTGRWAAVEANMAWYAHSYACDPDRVLDVVLRAAGPPARVGARDAPFVRARPC